MAVKNSKNARLDLCSVGHEDTGVFSSCTMTFYFHFKGRNILCCPTKTILNPPVIVFCKGMKLSTPKIFQNKTEPMNSGNLTLHSSALRLGVWLFDDC